MSPRAGLHCGDPPSDLARLRRILLAAGDIVETTWWWSEEEEAGGASSMGPARQPQGTKESSLISFRRTPPSILLLLPSPLKLLSPPALT